MEKEKKKIKWWQDLIVIILVPTIIIGIGGIINFIYNKNNNKDENEVFEKAYELTMEGYTEEFVEKVLKLKPKMQYEEVCKILGKEDKAYYETTSKGVEGICVWKDKNKDFNIRFKDNKAEI